MKLRYTPRAKLDIAEIHDYIAQDNPQAAKRVILLIRKAAESLPQILKSAGRDESQEPEN